MALGEGVIRAVIPEVQAQPRNDRTVDEVGLGRDHGRFHIAMVRIDGLHLPSRALTQQADTCLSAAADSTSRHQPLGGSRGTRPSRPPAFLRSPSKSRHRHARNPQPLHRYKMRNPPPLHKYKMRRLRPVKPFIVAGRLWPSHWHRVEHLSLADEFEHHLEEIR